MMRKILFWSIVLIVLACFAYLAFTPKSFKPTETKLADLKTIRIVLVGDMMFDRGVAYMIEKKGNSDFTFPFLNIADELNKADIVFGNLEGPISDKGTKVGSIYSFRNDPKTIDGLTFAGFDVISLANNHALDYSREALEDCLTRLSSAGISYAGAGFNEKEAFSPTVKEVAGTKIGFLAYTNLGPKTWRASGENSGIAWIDNESLDLTEQQIRKAKQDSDILIVSLHAGEEYQGTSTQFQVDFNEMAARAGADVVVNHHPHIIQQDFYSLGNFIFDQGFSEETMNSKIIEVKIQNKKIKEILQRNIKINNFFQPEIEL
jgi:poly-gamma-glutamate synthesis protein (capsule biosynthesis protein)